MIETLCNTKPKQFVRSGLLKQTVVALCKMCAEPDPDDYEEDSDDLPSNKIASQVHNQARNGQCDELKAIVQIFETTHHLDSNAVHCLAAISAPLW